MAGFGEPRAQSGDTLAPCTPPDGIGLIKGIRVHQSYRFIPIIMLTTESQESRKLEGKQAGATGWIVKPFNPEQLVKALLSATDTTVVSTLSVGKR